MIKNAINAHILMLLVIIMSYAPINVTPHHPQHGARWGNMGICACGFYNAPGVGERLACKSPTYPPLIPYW